MKTDFLSIRSVAVCHGDATITATVIFNNKLVTYCRTNKITMHVCALSVLLRREGTTMALAFEKFLFENMDIPDGKNRVCDFVQTHQKEWIMLNPWNLRLVDAKAEIPIAELLEEMPL